MATSGKRVLVPGGRWALLLGGKRALFDDAGVCGSCCGMVGACCFDDGDCSQLSFEACDAAGGYHWAGETDCEDAGCVALPGCCGFDLPKCFFSNWTSPTALVDIALSTSWTVEVAYCCPGVGYQIVSHTLNLSWNATLSWSVSGNPCSDSALSIKTSPLPTRTDYTYSCSHTSQYRLIATVFPRPASADFELNITVGGDTNEGNPPSETYLFQQGPCSGYTESGGAVKEGGTGGGGGYGECVAGDPPPFAGGTGRIRMTMESLTVALNGYKDCELGSAPARPARMYEPSRALLGPDGQPIARENRGCGDCGSGGTGAAPRLHLPDFARPAERDHRRRSIVVPSRRLWTPACGGCGASSLRGAAPRL